MPATALGLLFLLPSFLQTAAERRLQLEEEKWWPSLASVLCLQIFGADLRRPYSLVSSRPLHDIYHCCVTIVKIALKIVFECPFVCLSIQDFWVKNFCCTNILSYFSSEVFFRLYVRPSMDWEWDCKNTHIKTSSNTNIYQYKIIVMQRTQNFEEFHVLFMSALNLGRKFLFQVFLIDLLPSI